MFSISSMPGNELVETTNPGHYRPKNKSWKHRVQPYIRTDAAGVHCHIVGDSVCPYVQKKLRIDNLLRHFCALHEREAKERGFMEEDEDGGGVEEEAEEEEHLAAEVESV